ncbi:hypothetical protein [Salsipaludibacter albus]|uniref:hypothetical protein n=1 Tax=Salsipaludibacter albus TaxID=2849650 RepID=UPI001EE4DBCA|nr:hypothetical protein [Salsipaludibacter albus]MBY5161321.1 hypothetical protein [Salsipaludibacter albus]
MDDELGRRLLALSLHDDRAMAELADAEPSATASAPAARRALLVQVGALVCLNAETSTFQVYVEQALAAGIAPDELLGVLAALAPLAGTPRLAAGAASLARALGYDLDGALERLDDGDWSDPDRTQTSSGLDDAPSATRP